MSIFGLLLFNREMQKVQDVFLKTVDLGLKIDGEFLLRDINIQLGIGESLAITGASGSGKTLFGKLLSGQTNDYLGEMTFKGNPKRFMVDQQDHFISFSGRRSMHYGQRYESVGMESVPHLHDFLLKFVDNQSEVSPEAEINNIAAQVDISHLLERKILELSNGERKRTQLAVALLQNPDLLVLDQPFVGLDAHSREKLDQLLSTLIKTGICLIVICDGQQIPAQVKWVAEFKSGQLNQFVLSSDYSSQIDEDVTSDAVINPRLIPLLPVNSSECDDVVTMKSVNVNMGETQILKSIDWQIKKGEQWALLGPNGAGKSTLLSLLTADNPQGYNNDFYLFGKKRGSGESIWDIKKRIGFVSPELHLYFLRGAGILNTIPGLSGRSQQVYSTLTCREVIVSGFRDEVGIASMATDHQSKLADAWFSILKLEHLKRRLFTHTSLGEQRLLLLARALVKSPELLILDEPCQGLDHGQTLRFTRLLDTVCQKLGATLIYVTHHQDEIPSGVTHLLRLEDGEVKYRGKFCRKE